MKMIRNFIKTIIFLFIVTLWKWPSVSGKYVEGHLKTLDDWAFVARFCFISGRGRYEYHIEFERRYGEPQLLLYYDEKSQWPSVYKTDKSCLQKIAVLSVADNQIVTLSARPPYSYLSGCTLRSSKEPDGTKVTKPSSPSSSSSATERYPSYGSEIDPKYFDQFLKTSTEAYNVTDSSLDGELHFSGFNDTDVFNSSFVAYSADMGYVNNLENGTTYKMEVEEMFESSEGDTHAGNQARIRRSVPMFNRENRGTIIVSCTNAGGFTSIRERWWYIAIANCGTGKGLDVKYRFRMTNGAPGDFWHEHFSADEMYIPPILLTECLAYTFLLLAIFLCAIELKSRHLYHCTYRLFTFSAALQWAGILMQGVAWAKYAVTGLGPHITLGGILMGASEISFLALMLLMAKGYTITRARLSTCSTVKLTVFINVYIVAYIALYIYQAEAFDPGEVLNLYESPAGFGLIGLRCGSWGAFLCAIAITLRKYPEKGAFYYPFGLLGSLWILGGPLLTLIGIAILDAWVRESVMCGTMGAIAFGGHAAFLWLTWPSRANRSFPYHVRTNHVGIASDDDGSDYPRHPYEPSLPDQNIIIPLSRRTEELLNGVYNQYAVERELYGSPSNPISHVSFPTPVSAPHLTQIPEEQSPYYHRPNPVQLRLAQFQESRQNTVTKSTTIESATYPIGHDINDDDDDDDDNQKSDLEQVDSGHPSLDNSVSPNTTEPSSVQETPKQQHRSPPIDDQQQQSSSTSSTKPKKPNPFLANNFIRGPNKVILEPIEHVAKETTELSNDVPKHLFAVKKMI